MNETLLLYVSIAIAPSFAGLWWGWIVLAAVVLLFVIYCMRPGKQKSAHKNSWNDYFVDPPEYSDPKPDKNGAKVDVLQEIVQKQSDKERRTKNFFLWDDGLIFCGFKLQGTDLRTANLYGAYLRDMLLHDKGLGGSNHPLVLRDAEAYATIDMSATYLKNDLLHDTLINGADLGRVDLSGLYLRDVGLQGIDISNILESEESKFGDYFLTESYQKK
jgi:hypothetical protein